MKALKFLELLTVSEKKQLEKELKIQDNAELLQLWKIIQHHLRKGTPLPETKELINSIYGAAYSAKLDNRLRNLFFQLNEGAKKILVHKQLSTHSPKTRKYQQMILLEALQQRQADELYEKLLQEEMDNSLLQHDYLHYANLGNMQVLNEMLAGKDEKKKYYQASAMLEQQAPYCDAAIKSLIAQRNVVIG